MRSVAARWFDNVPNILTDEAMAAKEGLELAVEAGHERVILEVDCCSLKTMLDGCECISKVVDWRVVF